MISSVKKSVKKIDSWLNIDGSAQDCGSSSANALELPQSYAKPLMAVCFLCSLYLRFYRGRSGQSFPGTIPLFLCSTTSCRIWRVTQILCIVCIIWQGFVIISSCWWEYVYSMFSHGYLHNNCNLLTPPARWWDGLPEFIRPDWISVKRDKILCQHWSYIIFCANSSWLS